MTEENTKLDVSKLKRWSPDNLGNFFSVQEVFEEVQRLRLRCLSIEHAEVIGQEIYQLGLLKTEENGYLWDSVREDEEKTLWVPCMSYHKEGVAIHWAYLVYTDEMFVSINPLDQNSITLFI